MRRPARLGLILLVVVGALTACGSSKAASPTSAAAATVSSSTGAAAASSQLLDPGPAETLLKMPPKGLVVLDVRTPAEFAAGHLASAMNIDVSASSFANDVAKLDASLPYFVYCHSGNRSAKATAYMHAHGFTTLYELRGGITAWQAANKAVVTG